MPTKNQFKTINSKKTCHPCAVLTMAAVAIRTWRVGNADTRSVPWTEPLAKVRGDGKGGGSLVSLGPSSNAGEEDFRSCDAGGHLMRQGCQGGREASSHYFS